MPRIGSGNGSSSPMLQRAGLGGAFARFYQRTYAGDYIALGFLVTIWILIQLFVTPFHRMFSLDNKSIQYPMAAHERVPLIFSVIYSGLIPFGIILAWSAITRPGVQQTQATVLGLLVSLILTSVVTDIIKNAVGRPRPDLLARCKPGRGTPDNVLLLWTICKQTNLALLHEGWRSFPSGHSSFSFAGMGYFTLFLSGQMHVFRPRTDLGRCLIAFFPLLCALLVALSRLADYRHDVYDVTCGGLLGMLVAWFSYRRYYPALRSIHCDVPYDKTDLITREGFGRLGDEEQGVSQPFIPRDEQVSEEVFQLEETDPSR
ncbi:Phosphatidic acid phosphatase type 2/haloperoxidase [Penicillium malachiteum]|uniref:Phosphatidic acid phosphatase type 2/haloperoxidase n=1 Tax=Penicillium malachiteum TaxID=1324776 RepID=A0AAD6HQQ7_9EURO|nr:Phosphatidic acid phosphatase type 2/haloperoxidase [Penicillium malachiteum]